MKPGDAAPLWLCLYCRQLPLDCLAGEPTTLPRAIVEQHYLVVVNDTARRAGLRPGMRLATAYALEPAVEMIERQPERETQTLQQLTDWGYQFTPTVSAYKNSSLALEISGSLRLFQGLTTLLQRIEQGLMEQEIEYSAGLAHTPEAAWMFSHFHADHPEQTVKPQAADEFTAPSRHYWLSRLYQLPLHYLDIPTKQQQQIFKLGLRTLGELMALPRRELGKRLGKPLIDLLAGVTGERQSWYSDHAPPPAFYAQVDFDNGVTQTGELAQPLEQLAQQLHRFLYQHQLYTQSLEWRFYYYHQPADRLMIHISPANNTMAGFLELTHLKLEGYSLKAPLESLTLNSETFRTASAGSGELFPELSHPTAQAKAYQQLLDKLSSRLGANNLYTLSLEDEHLPEYRQTFRPLTPQRIEATGSPGPLPPANTQPPLPLWLMETPRPIDSPLPAEGHSRSPLRIVYGPQRIDSHWWQQRRRRDYYIARHTDGRYCWIFQDFSNGQWFLQGFYG